MSKQYFVHVEYKVTESIAIEANDPREAESKALELLYLGLTSRNIIDDDSSNAEVVSVEEIE